MKTTPYVIITPARNEAQFLQRTIQSVTSQSVRPELWVIVNDGSVDGTKDLADACAAIYSWVKVVHRSDRGRREAGSGVIAAFYDGYQLLGDTPWNYIVKLDGDLSFGSTYFEDCLREFEKNSKLGMGGGACCLEVGKSLGVEFPKDPIFHVRGPTKIYRRECWDAIGGLMKAPGWDGIDEIKANMHGWQTRTFQHIKLIHLRQTGTAYGGWKDNVKNGLSDYIAGYHPAFMAAKCAKRIFNKPYGIHSLALWVGFLKGYIQRIPRTQDKAMIKFLRCQQWRALTFRKSLWNS